VALSLYVRVAVKLLRQSFGNRSAPPRLDDKTCVLALRAQREKRRFCGILPRLAILTSRTESAASVFVILIRQGYRGEPLEYGHLKQRSA